ncbi:MAG: glutamate--tRNA ligase [Methanomassiliicoccales archaeon]|nr:glutamate--tRNA ligase [Methanomassiliicoccales archaeon]
MSNESIEDNIRKYALQNAFLYGGKANPKAVVGKVLAEHPEMRSRAREINLMTEDIVNRVNGIPEEDQRKMLENIDASLLRRNKIERIHLLPDLPEAIDGKVVMRFAPGPSGPLHIGHTRVAILNDEYVKRYHGEFINRIEDTNPEKIDPDAYHTIPEDLSWLGVEVQKTVIQTDRLQTYYDVARELLDGGHAYVCKCPVDDWRRLKEEGRACPHRDRPEEGQLDDFDRMLSGDYSEGEAVLVVKTDLAHPNPAIRDFIGLRIVTSIPHPRTGSRYSVYPMMNFSVAVDDHFLGLTHVLRGKDHLNNTLRQAYIFDYFGWTKPWYHHYGLITIPETILKTSIVGKGIKNGEYSGWDDVRLGTVRAIRRRGITPEAIREYWVDVGMKEVDIQFSWDTLYAFNKRQIDPEADRYFFVWNPVFVEIFGTNELRSYAPLHPDHPARGIRNLTLVGNPIRIMMNQDDLDSFKERGKIRLKDMCNLELENGKASFIGNDLSILKEKVRIVHWVPECSRKAVVMMPDGEKKEGYVEPIPDSEIGRIVQFERFGFVRIEETQPILKAVFTQN